MIRLIYLSALLALVTFLPLTDAMGTGNQQWEETFFRANQAYEEGRFEEAIDGYHSLLQSGHESGHVYYNLANAYFRLDRLGQAILNYERAHLLMPRDADLNFNLRYARDQTQDAVAESQGLVYSTFFWLKNCNLHELFFVFAILNLFYWTILALRLFFRSEWLFYVLLVALSFWVMAGASFGVKWYQVERDYRAVVLPSEVSILAGPDIKDTVLFKLHAGTIIDAERSEDGWTLVSLADGKRGWVRADDIETIL